MRVAGAFDGQRQEPGPGGQWHARVGVAEGRGIDSPLDREPITA